MANMSYCRFHNTAMALDDCYDALEAMINSDEKPLSREETLAAGRLFGTVAKIVMVVAEANGDLEFEDVIERMDDHRRAMALVAAFNNRAEAAQEDEE